MPDIDHWVMPDGWTTAHLTQPGITPLRSLCGRLIGGRPLLPNLWNDERCGQCARRRSAPTSGASS